MDSRPIGIFDSGVGGLTVVSQVMKALPYESTIYFGDTGRFPYGSKSKEIVLKYSKQIINFLKSQDVKAIIIACNTVSSSCYQELTYEFKDIPIIEIVTSGVEDALKFTKNYKIGIVGTETTVKSLEYQKRIKKIKQEVEVFSMSCPKFAPLAEEGNINTEVTLKTAKTYLTPLLDKGIDTLVLGCTHYPLLIESIQKIIPKNVRIIDPAIEVANKMKYFLQKNNMLSEQKSFNKFYVSELSDKFDFMCSLVLQKNYVTKKVYIEKY